MLSTAGEGLKKGYSAFKYSPLPPVHFMENQVFLERYTEDFAAVREKVGKSVDLAVDFHGRFSPAFAKRFIKKLEPYYPYFVEEPCLPEYTEALADVAHSTTVPIAAGERCYTKWGFREMLNAGGVKILQPDISHAGGILETRKIAAMAEACYVALAPHNPLGPIALAAAVQLDACIPNFLIQEHVTLGEGYLQKPFQLLDGYIEVPEGPGLSIALDEDALKERMCSHIGPNPIVYHTDDGAVADW
jgi:galactonate dehydratase